MDGGSPINIRYLDTFTRLGLPQSIVEPSNCTFHGIVLGRKAYSLGKVFLPVTFGTPANFRTEKIMFELVNFAAPITAYFEGRHSPSSWPPRIMPTTS